MVVATEAVQEVEAVLEEVAMAQVGVALVAAAVKALAEMVVSTAVVELAAVAMARAAAVDHHLAACDERCPRVAVVPVSHQLPHVQILVAPCRCGWLPVALATGVQTGSIA